MVTTGDIITVLGTTAPAGDLAGATFKAAQQAGFNDIEASYLAQVDAIEEAQKQNAPAHAVQGLREQADQFLAANGDALANLIGLGGAPTPEASLGNPATSTPPIGASAAIVDPIIGAPGATGELNLGFGADFLGPAMALYTDILQIGTQRELTLEELTYKREVEQRLKDQFAQELGLSRDQLTLQGNQFEAELNERIRQFDDQLLFNRQEASRNQGNIEADRNLDIAGRIAALRANPLSAAESVLFQDQIQGVGPSGQGLLAQIAQAMGGSSPGTAGAQTQNLDSNITARNFVRGATQGAGGRTRVGLGGLDVNVPRTLSGGQLSKMSDASLGVFDSFSAAGGNPNAVARSARALVPGAFSGVAAGV